MRITWVLAKLQLPGRVGRGVEIYILNRRLSLISNPFRPPRAPLQMHLIIWQVWETARRLCSPRAFPGRRVP